MTFDLNKPVRQKNGYKARIIGGLEGGPERIAVAITISGMEFAEARYTNGMYLNGEESDRDLINIPEKRWVNVYPKSALYKTKGEADTYADYGPEDRIACIPFTEGDGL